MKKYIEFGLGNTWLVRTEIENNDGTEYEVKGIYGKLKIESIYIRLWIWTRVIIIDSKDGIKLFEKKRNAWKLILGIKSGC